MVEPLGLTLPEEARVLWQWADGVDGHRQLVWSTELVPLRRAVELREEQRALGAEWWADGLDPERYFWPSRFLPVADRQTLVAIDCAADPIRAPVYSLHTHDRDDYAVAQPEVPSLGVLVQWWIEAWETGYYGVDPIPERPGAFRWRLDDTRSPPFERRHLV